MTHCSTRSRDAYFADSQETVQGIRRTCWPVLDQNPGVDWRNLVGSLEPEGDSDPSADGRRYADDDELESFRLKATSSAAFDIAR